MNLLRSFCCVLVFSAIPGWANAVLTFNIGSGGTIAYAGGANPLTGTSIPVVALIASGDPQNNGSYTVENGILSFQTGSFSSYDSNQQSLYFAAGGNISITGTVDNSSGNITGSVADPLLSGSFLGASFDLNYNRFSLFMGDGPDVKNQQLVSYFFGSDTPSWTFSADLFGSHSEATDYHSNGSFSTAVADHVTIGGVPFNSQVVNTSAVASVPEPASMIMMGLGLIGVSLGLRRQKSRRIDTK